MARERMVTRTVSTTTIEVLVVNIESSEVGTKYFILGQNSAKDEKAMLKVAQKIMNEETNNELWKCVTVKSTKEEETLYGMPETEFIKYAKVLPPR